MHAVMKSYCHISLVLVDGYSRTPLLLTDVLEGACEEEKGRIASSLLHCRCVETALSFWENGHSPPALRCFSSVNQCPPSP